MSNIVRMAINEALTEMLPVNFNTQAARLMMLVIQKQEDPEERRYQVVRRVDGTLPKNIVGPKTAKGPARGLWQFEAGGGIHGVLTHKKTRDHIRVICDHYNVPATARACWEAVENNDILAACFARLLLWSDPLPLPKINEPESAWDLYLRTWRPGAYTNGDAAKRAELRTKFLKNHAAARVEMGIQ